MPNHKKSHATSWHLVLFIVYSRCGLPIATYFSAVKLRWLLDNIPAVAEAHDNGSLMMGTVDTWLLYNFTGRQEYATDVTNASRTMLMNIHSLTWDKQICQFFGVNHKLLPEIRSSAEVFGQMCDGVLEGVPISGILGDQQAALMGQGCRRPGQAKNTYGTGCFLLYNTGDQAVFSEHGLLTTVACQMGRDAKPTYALEGSVAIAGAAVKWLRDSMKIVESTEQMENLARSVTDTHGCYFVPAFSGLFAPYWRSDARGLLIGLTQFTNPGHIARALLEAISFQTRELLDAMTADSGIELEALQVDGGMTKNKLLLQLQVELLCVNGPEVNHKSLKPVIEECDSDTNRKQSSRLKSKNGLSSKLMADLAGLPVLCPTMAETTALGAAVAAAIGVGLNADSMTGQTLETFVPSIDPSVRDDRYRRWKRAVHRSIGWDLNEDDWTALPDVGGKISTADPEKAQEKIYRNTAFAAFFLGGLVTMYLSALYRK